MTAYHEQRAVLRDNEAMVEIEVRGGLEADDGSEALDVTIREVLVTEHTHEHTMRIPIAQWRAFVRAVGRLR
jgi:hypothetical protein